ncbi:hypothetical protein, partial [Shewanella surugensis]
LSYNDCTKVTERINKIDNKAITGQFLKDTNRADYFLNGEKMASSEVEGTFANKVNVQRGICQTIFAEILKDLQEKRGMHLDVPGVGDTADIQYRIQTNKNNSSFDIQISLRKDITTMKDNEYFNDYLAIVDDSPNSVNSLKIEANIKCDGDNIVVTKITQSIT